MRTALVVAAVVLGVLALGVVGLIAFGATLPPDHTVTVTRAIAGPPDVVWARILAYDQHASWRTGLRAATRAGDRVEETDDNGDVLAYRIVEEVPERRLVTEIVDQSLFSGRWTFALTADGDGTAVAITEQGAIPSRLVRAAAWFFLDPKATATRYLDDLERACVAIEAARVP